MGTLLSPKETGRLAFEQLSVKKKLVEEIDKKKNWLFEL